MATDSEGKLVRLSHTHEQMLNWLVLNPDKSLRECADHFSYTQSWVSSIIHSDLFQAALKEKQLAIAARVAGSIPEKLRAAADIGLEKLTRQLEETEDPEYILDATDKILHRMGYAPVSARSPAGSPGQGLSQQNNFFITSGDLAAARELMQGAVEATAPRLGPQGPIPPAIEGELLPLEPGR